MEYQRFLKKLELPDGVVAPTELTYQDIVATALTRADLADDVRGINASVEIIRKTRGGDWPPEETTEEFNYTYLVWHELEFDEGGSFTYVVRDTNGDYLGCAYLYPMGRRTALTEELLGYDVDVSWWVTTTAYGQGYYAKLYAALQHWIANDVPLGKAYYSNREIPG